MIDAITHSSFCSLIFRVGTTLPNRYLHLHLHPRQRHPYRRFSYYDDDYPNHTFVVRNGFTRFVTLLLLGTATYHTMDYLGTVVSLLGSMVGIPLIMVVPPLLYTVLMLRDHNDEFEAEEKGDGWTISALVDMVTRDESLMGTRERRWMNYCVAGSWDLFTVVRTFETIVGWNEGLYDVGGVVC